MSTPSVIVVVMLRRPNLNDPREMRSDPFWEFGSFGCTRCHARNLLNPRRASELEGSRLAFVQGGPAGFRLVYITPPVSVVRHLDRCELKWLPREMPIRYSMAPTIVANDQSTDTPAIFRELRNVARSRPVGQFASKFRSRRKPVEKRLAHELETAYRKHRRRSGAVARRYEEAMPFPPPKIDRSRVRTYREILSKISLFPKPKAAARLRPKSC